MIRLRKTKTKQSLGKKIIDRLTTFHAWKAPQMLLPRLLQTPRCTGKIFQTINKCIYLSLIHI